VQKKLPSQYATIIVPLFFNKEENQDFASKPQGFAIHSPSSMFLPFTL
jgi:hypothetical protein